MKEKELFPAIRLNDIETVKSLLLGGANVNHKEEYGVTLLHWASTHGHFDMCQLLLDNGADVNATDIFGNTPLYWAVSTFSSTPDEKINVVRLLLDNGADANKGIASLTQKRPLHEAAHYNNIELCKLLIEHGADVNVKSIWGDTPLSLALNIDVINLLKEHGTKK